MPSPTAYAQERDKRTGYRDRHDHVPTGAGGEGGYGESHRTSWRYAIADQALLNRSELHPVPASAAQARLVGGDERRRFLERRRTSAEQCLGSGGELVERRVGWATAHNESVGLLTPCQQPPEKFCTRRERGRVRGACAS